MLGKQGWRLITNPDSLLAQNLKARYYPRGSFVKARKSYKPSYFWRSILERRDLLVKGLRWRVGNGEDILVWKDRWLPDEFQFKAVPINANVDPNLKVCDLMNLTHITWNMELILHLFDPDVAKQILAMHLSWRRLKDVMQ